MPLVATLTNRPLLNTIVTRLHYNEVFSPAMGSFALAQLNMRQRSTENVNTCRCPLSTSHIPCLAGPTPTRIGPTHRTPSDPCSAACPKTRLSLVAPQRLRQVKAPKACGVPLSWAMVRSQCPGAPVIRTESVPSCRLLWSGARVRHPPCPT